MIDAKSWRRLGVAAGLSGVAHAAVVAVGRIEVPESPQDRPPLAVRVATVTPQAPAPARAAVAAPVEGPRRAGVRVATSHTLAAAALPAATAPAEDVETAASDVLPVAEAGPAQPEPPVVVATAPASTAAPEPALRSLPRKGRITYNLVYGRDRFPVGRTVQTWEMDGGRYQLASRSETTGIVDFLRSQQRSYSSSGVLTRDGLKPEAFQMSRNRGRGAEEASARFDWGEATVTLGRTAQTRRENLPSRSQDLLSFMYQLSLDPPPPGRLRQVVTNGSRIEVYELEVLREETIDTPLGMLRALPVKQVRKANEESIELWLAVDYSYLPVRLRFFNREGELQGEQIVAEIRLSEN